MKKLDTGLDKQNADTYAGFVKAVKYSTIFIIFVLSAMALYLT